MIYSPLVIYTQAQFKTEKPAWGAGGQWSAVGFSPVYLYASITVRICATMGSHADLFSISFGV